MRFAPGPKWEFGLRTKCDLALDPNNDMTDVEPVDLSTLQFSTSVEVRVLIPSVVRLSLVTTFPG